MSRRLTSRARKRIVSTVSSSLHAAKRICKEAVLKRAADTKREPASKTLKSATNRVKKKRGKPKLVHKVLSYDMPLPTRNKKGELVFKDHPEFRPNLTPKQVLQAGAFGGSYFRNIASSVTGSKLKGVDQIVELPEDWFEGLNLRSQVCSPIYNPSVNKYGVRCGGGLDMWESSGWINEQDPYGWFQWYCHFYLGRRSVDDRRQISRGNGVMSAKGRWRNNLIGRCARNGKAFDDFSVSPVVRQALLHWGYILTEADADSYVRKKGLPELPEPIGIDVMTARHKPKGKPVYFDPYNMAKKTSGVAKFLASVRD